MWKWPIAADLTGTALRGVAQRVQIVGFLAIIAIYGATQGYFSFTMGGLKNRIDNVYVIKSEKMQWCYEKTS